MKKIAFSLSGLLAFSSLFAAAPLPPRASSQVKGQTPVADECSHLSQAERSFSSQIMDTKNKTMFCSQFTMQQRKQAMQLMDQPDSSGNTMNADQAVQEVMGSGAMVPMTPQKMKPSGGGCPVN